VGEHVCRRPHPGHSPRCGLAEPAAVCSACPITAECADLAELSGYTGIAAGEGYRNGRPDLTRARAPPRTQDGMSAWQLCPNHVWLADGDHAVVLLVMGLPERRGLGATVVQNPADAAALLSRLVDAHGCPETLRSIWDPLFEDLNAAAREAVHQAGCAKPVGQLEPDDFVWALDTGNAATQAIRSAHPGTVHDVATALEAGLNAPARTSSTIVAGRRSGSLTVDAHPCEGPGSDPRISCGRQGLGVAHTTPRHAMTAALPVSLAPRPGESIESWLEHLADANGLTTAQLLTTTGRGRIGTRYLTLAPSSETITRLAALARVDEQDVYAASLAVCHGTAVDLTGLDADDRHSYRQVAARGWTPAHGTQICPRCLAEDGAWRAAWRLLMVITCTQHRSLLVARCPSCVRPFRDQRHSHLRRVGAARVCGNPLGAGPTKQCQHDLTTIEATSATDDVLALQARIDTALAGQQVTVLGQAAKPAAYLADLRHLTTLLLHLAGQPGAPQLALWVAYLAEEADARSGGRGPRWGLRPPEQPGLRAEALATADGILTAPDIDVGAARLTPWTELTPITNEGPLGWLADRTVMTPTLTRLVMAARAPHRRLSHHLDTHLGGRMPINLTLVPQVIPHAQYLEHLDGASSSGEHTVRLFASLSLARLHPDVTSWAAAAEALNMPGPMGVRCARACSATMLVSAEEWKSRIWRAGEETERRDYRATEAKIHHRLGMTRWFNEWARRNRPDARYGEHDLALALAWQWVHVAHAHLDLSPAWRGRKPNAKDRVRYHRFAASLSDQQGLNLASGLFAELGLIES